MGAATFVISTLLAALISREGARIALGESDVSERRLGALAGFPVVVLWFVLSFGSLGQLAPAKVITGLVLVLCLLLAVRSRSAGSPRASWRADALWGQGGSSQTIALSLATTFGLIWCGLLICSGSAFGWDDFTYHGPVVAHWLTDQRVSLAPYNYQAYYPLNAATLSLWFVMPVHADGLASLSGLYWAGLLLGAASLVAARIGATTSSAVFAAGLLLASPVLLEAARTFSATDLAGPATATTAIAFAIVTKPEPKRALFARFVYCGLLSGYAAGCKASLLPIPPLLLVWLFIATWKKQPARVIIVALVAFVAAALATGAYWYARAWSLTGNPLYPAQIGPFAGPFGPDEQTRTTLIHWLGVALGDPRLAYSLAREHVYWPIGLCALSILGYGAGLLSIVRARARSSPAFGPRTLVLTVGLILLILYPHMPFSGTYDEPHGDPAVSLRFIILPFSIGIILFAPILDGGAKRRLVTLLAAVAVAIIVAFRMAAWVPFMFLPGLAMAWLIRQHAAVLHGALTRFGVPLLCGLVIAVGILSPWKQALTDETVFSYGGSRHPIGRAWKALELVPHGSRVASFGPDSYRYYATFGRRLQLVPVRTQGDGSPYLFAHEYFARHRLRWWDPRPLGRLERLAGNLYLAGIDYVVVSKWNLDEWPPQQQVLAASGIAQSWYSDGYTTIWRIRRPDPREEH